MGVHLACASKVYHSAHLTPHFAFASSFSRSVNEGALKAMVGSWKNLGPSLPHSSSRAWRVGQEKVVFGSRAAVLPSLHSTLHCYERACCKEGLHGRVCQRRVAYDKGRLTREAVPFAGSMDDRDILNIFAKTPNFVSKARQSNPARFFPSFPVRARACSEGVGR